VNRNTNYNNNINRNNYANKVTTGQGGQGKWQHNPEHRKGVSYKDQGSRDKYGQLRPGAEYRKDFRGQSPDTRNRQVAGSGAAGRDRPTTADRRKDTPGRDMAGRDSGGRGGQATQQPRQSSAFDGMDKGGRDAKMSSDRGSSSRQSMSSSKGSGASRPSGGSVSRGGGGGGGGRGGGGRGR